MPYRPETHRCTFPLQPQQRESQGQAQPEGVRRGSEVKDEAITGPVARARGHDAEEEHHGQEAAPADGQIQQRGGESQPDVEQSQSA